jgi:hypothetical protein
VVPDGRLASGTWLVNDLGGDGIELSWKESGGFVEFCGWAMDPATAEAFMRAVEAEAVPDAKESLSRAGFVREIPQGFHPGTPPLILRDGAGKLAASISSDYETTLDMPQGDEGCRRIATAVLPMDGANQPCSLTRGRRIGDLTVAAMLACWRSNGGR